MTWIKINPLLILRSLISAAYLNKSVIVASLGDETVMLSLPFGQPSRWTLIVIGIFECQYLINLTIGNSGSCLFAHNYVTMITISNTSNNKLDLTR